MIILMVIGGGIGSTAGGIKLGRVCILLKNLVRNIRKKMVPDRTVLLAYYHKGTEKELIEKGRIEEASTYAECYVLIYLFGMEAFKTILNGNYQDLKTPGMLALFAAIASIISKEGMYWYTRYHAKRIDSSALMADAWHHRSDAFSSIGALIGILGARMGYPVMDSGASLVIFVFIVKASYDIFKDAMDKMVDHSCDEKTEQQIYDCVMENQEVLGIDLLQTRIFGNKIYIDVEIQVDGTYPLQKAHDIAEIVHNDIECRFPKVKHIMVHVNPGKVHQSSLH